MKTIKTLLVVSVAVPLIAYAEAVPAPTAKPGDSWTYVDTVETAPNVWRQTHDEIVVLRSTPDHIYYSSKQAGSTQAENELIAGADWSRSRNVNGTETTVNRPLSFPLSTGKSWEVKYTEAHPNPKHDSESFDSRFRVVGPEKVEVPAGKFDAIKVEAEGEWTAQLAPMHATSSATISNQTGATIVMNARNVTPASASAIQGILVRTGNRPLGEIGRGVLRQQRRAHATLLERARIVQAQCAAVSALFV